MQDLIDQYWHKQGRLVPLPIPGDVWQFGKVVRQVLSVGDDHSVTYLEAGGQGVQWLRWVSWVREFLEAGKANLVGRVRC